jgi:hypothetical protein
MPVIDQQPPNSKCLLARMQSTAAPLSVVVHITAKMGPRAKRKELGRTCMQLEFWRASSLHRPVSRLSISSADRSFLDFNNRNHIKQETQKPTSSTRPLKSRNLFPPKRIAIMHTTCPKCSAAVAGGSKTCSSCGSVRFDSCCCVWQVLV